jgi:signal transduction histidine kinase/ligand-binding sensor domain-containing protein
MVMAGTAWGERPRGDLAFRSFTPEDGLTNLVVLAIAEDREGALWVGTDDGLFRIDGEHVVRFGREAGVVSSHIHAIAAAPDGALCVAGEDGLACGRGGQFVAVAPTASVTGLAVTPDALWIATNHGLLARRGSEVVPVDGGPAGDVTLLWADDRGVIAGRQGALMTREPGGAWRPLEVEVGAGDPIREIRRDRSGALWLRTATRMWRVRRGEIRGEDVTFHLPPSVDARFSSTMAASPDGDLVAATQAGVATFHADRWEVVGRARGLPTASAHVVYYDRVGDLWVGSIGIHRQLGRGLLERYTAATGFPGEAAWAIARGPRGELLVGTSQCLAEGIDGRWRCVAGTEGRVVRSIVAMPDGEVYFGAQATLYRRARDGGVSEVGQLEASRRVPRILSIAVAVDGSLWIGSDVGIWRRPPGGVPAQVLPPEGDPTRFVSAIVADGPRMWFAGHEGLRIFEDGRWSRLTIKDGLRATEVRYLARRRDGRLCVLYDQGLGVTCFRRAAGRLTDVRHVAAAEGLDAPMAYSLGEDRDGRLWIGTGAGLRVVTDDPAAPIDRFTARDGLSGDDATAMGFRLDDDGGLWFGSSAGLSHVAAERYHGPPTPPTVRVLALAVGAGDHGVRASFLANHHVEAEVEYQVRLRPHDDGWAGAKAREVRFSSLPPGDYQLEIQARARGGAWGAVTHAPFTIPAAWWQSPWVWLVGVVLGLGVAAMLVRGWQRATLQLRTRLLASQTDASFRAFVASMPDVVIVRRADGGIYLNEAAQQLLGQPRPRGERWLLRRVHPADRARAVALLRRVPGDRALVELRVRGDDGWRDLEVTHQTIELVGATAHVVVARDVSERRRMQAKMLIADRMVSLGTLAAGIGHEINNPLAYVRGNLEVIGEILENDDVAASRGEIAAALHDAIDGADRVGTIVRGLSSFNHATQERRVEVALDDVIRQAARLTHNELRHRAELVLDLRPTPPVLGDPGRLTQVVINVLINAAHAVAPGAADRNQIAIRTRSEGATVVLEVEDHGVGMEPEVVARVFDPFFTTKRVGEGTGLGLSICHGIVTGLGGQISVESQPERGTTVRIALPGVLATSAPPPVAPPPSLLAPSLRPRVLIVDDEPAVGEMLGRMLRADCEVTVLTSGEDALRRIAGGARYDAIVSDVMMPVTTGLELRDRLLAAAPDQAARLVFVTGGAFNTDIAERLEALDVPRLAKPFTAEALRGVVYQVAGAQRMPSAAAYLAPPPAEHEADAGGQ